MQAHSRWLQAIRKRVITEKTWRKKNMKLRNCFAPKSLSRALYGSFLLPMAAFPLATVCNSDLH